MRKLRGQGNRGSHNLSVFERALVGVHGATRFLSAVMRGDRAPDAVVLERRAKCLVCPYRQRMIAPGAVAESDFCGTPFVVTEKTCGCLVAGKTLVGGESCPQGKWGPV